MQMQYTKELDNESVLGIIQRFCNYIDPRLMEHGSHVAYIISRMLKDTGQYSQKELRDICFLAQLHDIGAYKTEEISRMLQFETNNIWNHSFYGYLFIRYFSPLKELAPAVLLHHITWNFLEKEEEPSTKLKDLSQILHIADRIDVAMSLEKRSWSEVLPALIRDSNNVFAPHIIDLAAKLDFQESIDMEWRRDSDYYSFLTSIPLSEEETTDYLKMLVFIIDFRSHHTVTHTITTTSISYELGKLLSLDEHRLNLVLCGSLLHDLGKIAIPVEILEYPGKLNHQSMNIMRTHVNFTEKIFGGSIDQTIERIALRHHEKLNGGGYPLKLKAEDLTMEERLVAIADIISALTGARSYKSSFSTDHILSILTKMKLESLLDPDILDLAMRHLDEILDTTAVRCRPILSVYEKLKTEYASLSQLKTYEEKLYFALTLKDPELKPSWP